MKKIIILCCCLFAGSANALVIGSFGSSRINYANGVFETGSYANIRADLSVRGDTISTISTLDAASLSGVDVFYTSLLNTSTGVLSASEQTALLNWVAAGGTLFSAGDISTWFPAYNSFLNPFGITIGPNSGGTDTATVVDFSSPITNGPNGSITSFDFFTAGLFSAGSYNTLATYGGDAILIQMGYGLGQVVAVGDHNLFTDSYIGANENILFLNVLDSANYSAAVPEPTSLALLGLGLAGIGFSRKKRNI